MVQQVASIALVAAIGEIEVDGFKLWTSAGKYAETVRIFRPEAAREDATIVVDALPNIDASRGDGRLASAVRTLRFAKTCFVEQVLDPKVQQEFFQEFGLRIVERGASWVLAKAITWLIERLVRSSIGDTRFNADAARALFELMVPNDLKTASVSCRTWCSSSTVTRRRSHGS